MRRRLSEPSARALTGTLAGNAMGFVLPFAVAAHFGAGRVTDAYVFALALAQFCVALGTTALESNALPAAGLARRTGRTALLGFVRRTSYQAVAALVAVFLVVSVVGFATVNGRASWTSSERHEATLVLVALIGYVACTAAASVRAGALYALGDFLTPTLSSTLRAALPLAAIPWLGQGGTSVATIALLISVGEGFRTVLLHARLRQLCKSLPDGFGTTQPPIWGIIAPHALSLCVVAANPVIDRAIASSLHAGSATVLDLGEKVFFVPLTVVMSSVGLVAGARWASASTPEALEQELKDAMRRAVAIALALAVAIGAAAMAVGALVGPRFAGASTDSLLNVTLVLLLGLPPAAVGVIGGRFLTSTRQTRGLPAFALLSVVANTVFDVVGSRMYGVVGIAAATVLVRTFSAIAYSFYCKRVARRLARGGAAEAPRPRRSAGRLSPFAMSRRPRSAARVPARLLVGGASAFLAALAGAMLAFAPLATVLVFGTIVLGAAVTMTPVRYLPAAALTAYAFLPTPYLNVPSVAGRFFSPAIVILAVWVVRVRPVERARAPRAWRFLAVVVSLWIGWGALTSFHQLRTAAWAVVFLIAVPGAGAAAYRSDRATRDALLSTWVAIGVILGALGVVEGLAKYNPLARFYVDAGTPLAQKWSVYRIETTLGHPLDNAMFFASTACLLTILAVRAPSRWRWAGAAASTAALVLTVSRTGVLAAAVGIGVGLIAAGLSSQLSLGRKVIVCATITLALFGAANAPVLKERGQSSEARSSAQYRVQVVSQSLEIARRFGYTGSGAGTSQTAATLAGYKLTVESSPLELLISTGVPGVAMLFAFVLSIFATALRTRRLEAVAALAALLVAVSGFNAWDADPASLALLALVFILGAGGAEPRRGRYAPSPAGVYDGPAVSGLPASASA